MLHSWHKSRTDIDYFNAQSTLFILYNCMGTNTFLSLS